MWCISAELSLVDILILDDICLCRSNHIRPQEAMNVFDIYLRMHQKKNIDALKMRVTKTPIKEEIAGIGKQPREGLHTAISTKSTLNGFKDS